MPKGRPVGSGKDRFHFLRVRVSEAELERLDRDRGLATRSEWVRQRLFGKRGRGQ
jgi:hypothetical protein